ncbi:MAG: Eco57I restriction-modification methylase domain-containing protein [Geobacteraceae bacterium]|nr:Eco57I restriction-modification methylase domain-containing protein [Geobacteraceae bacterium]
MKSSGSYYTPYPVAKFVVTHLLSSFHAGGASLTVLEPSAGDGVFIKALNSVGCTEILNSANIVVDAIDINNSALSKLREIPLERNVNLNVTEGDFLLTLTPSPSYDIVIGNPPYISHHHLTQEQLQACSEIHSSADLSHFRIRNIWPSFLVKCIQLVKPDGALAFVLPSEFLQVKYALELQALVLANFERVEIFSFARILFKGIEQDTVLVIAWKKSTNPGLFFSPVFDEQELIRNSFSMDRHQNSKYKWSSHFLDDFELKLVTSASDALTPLDDLCISAAGVVTAANNFFILNASDVSNWELGDYARPIIKSGAHVSRLILIEDRDIQNVSERELPCYLIDLNHVESLDESLRRYLEHGELAGLPNRHKCTKRVNWYKVPNIWSSEVIFFKRAHKIPKFLLNKADVLVTDTAYRVRVKPGVDPLSLVSSFYNSLTLTLVELEGRSYGGGVLELTPNEFRKVRIPHFEHDQSYFDTINKMVEDGTDFEDIICFNDTEILTKKLQLSTEVVSKLRHIREKLLSRRLMKNNYNQT